MKIDLSNVRKGSVVPAEQIERATKVSRGESGYRIAQLKVRDHCRRLLKKVFGSEVVVVCDHDDLRVLTDSEAVPYLARRHRSHRRGMYRDYRKLQGVDRSKLDREERAALDHSLDRHGRELQAVRKKNLPPLRVHTRTVPGGGR